jgi:hypothetical protein
MPIDLTPALAQLAVPLRRQSVRIALAFTVITAAAERRLTGLRDIAGRVAAFPVWAFAGRALSVSLHPRQHGGISAYASRGAAAAAPFVAFGRGVAGFVQDARNDLALPRLLGQLRGLFDLLLASIERVERAGPRLFDLGRARLGDLVGVAALISRSRSDLATAIAGVGEQIGRIQGLAQGSAVTPASATSGEPGGGPRRGQGEAGTGSTPALLGLDRAREQLTQAGQVMTAALMLLPALPGMLETLARRLWLRGRGLALDQLQRVEARVLALRRTVWEWAFRRLPQMLAPYPVLVAIASAMVVDTLTFWLDVGQRWVTQLLGEVRRYLGELTLFLNIWINVINALGSLLQSLLSFDILEPILDLTGLSALYRRFGLTPPSLNLGDILDASGTAVRVSARVALEGSVRALRALVPASLMPNVDRRLGALAEVIAVLFQAPRPYPDERVGPVPVIAPFPNLYDTLIGRPRAAVVAAVRDWGHHTADRVGLVFLDLGTAMDRFAGQAAELSRAAARVVPAARIRRFAGAAEVLGERLFGDQAQALRDTITGRRRPGGSGFETWLVTGGFHVIGALIPLYVTEMRDFWRARRRGEGEVPVELESATSPHLLARRARLARVRMDTLTIAAGNRPLDPELAREIAARFRVAVGQAYLDGRRRLAAAAAD